MNRLFLVVLIVLVVVGVAIVAGTSTDLPARVAVHFGASGAPDRWSSRETYVALMIGLVIGTPLIALAAIAWLPRLGKCVCKLPNREYWLAPARREETFDRLSNYAAVLGWVLVAFMTGAHLLVVMANASARVALPTEPFLALMIALGVATIAWVVAFSFGFRAPA